MAEIDFPSVKLNQFSLRPTAPNIIRHSSVFAAKEQVHSRGNMFFLGTLTWARRNIATHLEDMVAIETFLTRAYGPVNTFKVPVPRDQEKRYVSEEVELTGDMNISGLTNGVFESTFNGTVGLLVGDYFNAGSRLHVIVAATGAAYTAAPALVGAPTRISWSAPKLNARMATDSLDLPRTGGWGGPWTFDVQEVL